MGVLARIHPRCINGEYLITTLINNSNIYYLSAAGSFSLEQYRGKTNRLSTTRTATQSLNRWVTVQVSQGNTV